MTSEPAPLSRRAISPRTPPVMARHEAESERCPPSACRNSGIPLRGEVAHTAGSAAASARHRDHSSSVRFSHPPAGPVRSMVTAYRVSARRYGSQLPWVLVPQAGREPMVLPVNAQASRPVRPRSELGGKCTAHACVSLVFRDGVTRMRTTGLSRRQRRGSQGPMPGTRVSGYRASRSLLGVTREWPKSPPGAVLVNAGFLILLAADRLASVSTSPDSRRMRWARSVISRCGHWTSPPG
jgi:hypothetical protein